MKRCEGRAGQAGATVVEFAFVFPILFLLVYGTIVYSYVYVLQQAITFTAQQAAESAVAVNPMPAASFDQRASQRVKAVVQQQLSWLSPSQRLRVLGDSGQKIQISFPSVDGASVVQVKLVFDLDGLFPAIRLPMVGAIPPLPSTLSSQALARI